LAVSFTNCLLPVGKYQLFSQITCLKFPLCTQSKIRSAKLIKTETETFKLHNQHKIQIVFGLGTPRLLDHLLGSTMIYFCFFKTTFDIFLRF